MKKKDSKSLKNSSELTAIIKIDVALILLKSALPANHSGLYFDLARQRHTFKVRKSLMLSDFKKKVADYYSLPHGVGTYWFCKKDASQTFRPRSVWKIKDTDIVERMWNAYFAVYSEYPKLFLEVIEGKDNFESPPEKTADVIMLFFKFVEEGKTSFVGQSYLKKDSTLTDFVTQIQRVQCSDVCYKFYQEGAGSIFGNEIDKGSTIKSTSLEDGDTVLMKAEQKALKLVETSGSVIFDVALITNFLVPVDLGVEFSFLDQEVAGQRLYELKVPCEKEGFFDFVDSVEHFEESRSTTVHQFKEHLAKVFDLRLNCSTFWVCAKEGHCFRPRQVWQPEAESSLGLIWDESDFNDSFKLFVDKSNVKTDDNILVFFKLLDPSKLLGRLYVAKAASLNDLSQEIRNMLKIGRFHYNSYLEFYKEGMGYQKCGWLDILKSFGDLEILDGDTLLVEVNSINFQYSDLWLQSVFNKSVLVQTGRGDIIVGVLSGFDHEATVVLADARRRIFSTELGVTEEPLGLVILRRDSINFLGELERQ